MNYLGKEQRRVKPGRSSMCKSMDSKDSVRLQKTREKAEMRKWRVEPEGHPDLGISL